MSEIKKRDNRGRGRVVAWIVGTTALGMLLLVFGISLSLRLNAEAEIERALIQETGELRRFAETAQDPDTGEAFSTAERLVDVYLTRQQPAPAELMVGGPVGAEVTQQRRGDAAPAFNAFDAGSQEAIKAVGSNGSRNIAGVGTVSWSNVEVRSTNDAGFVAIIVAHEPGENEIRRQLLLLGGLASLALLATGVVAWLVSGRILSHTAQFERAAEAAIAARGVPEIPEEGSSEYLRLAQTANKLLHRAEEVIDREQQFTEDITHQLRTPLAIINGGLEQPGATHEQGEMTRTRLLTEVSRLRVLVDHLAVLTRVERPDYVHATTHVDAAQFVEEFIAEWQARIADMPGPHVRIVEGNLQPGLQISIDEPRLAQALDELVENAIDGSGNDGVITVGVRHAADDENEYALIEVSDGGRGVPEEERSAVMRRFGLASNDPEPGAGLGLPVAARLVEAHGGKLQLADGRNGGLTARVRLAVVDPESVSDDDEDDD